MLAACCSLPAKLFVKMLLVTTKPLSGLLRIQMCGTRGTRSYYIHTLAPDIWFRFIHRFSDVELDVGRGKTIRAHSFVLIPKSTWFARQCPETNLVKLQDLPKKLSRHFGFHEYDAEVRREGLIAMINFCYTGCYGTQEIGRFSQ